MKKLELKNVKGTYDYGSTEQKIRNEISDTLRKVFEKYGYQPLTTPILCYYDLLALKYDEENDILKEIYPVTDQANRKLALRYDLTVPFAKYIAINPNIRMPYKRYEIGKVFRDGPVKQGRVREFIQCDVDSVGIEGQMVEAELMTLFLEGCQKLGIDVTIKYNNRKILSGIIQECEIAEEKMEQVITIIDKFEKLTKEEISEQFEEIGIEKRKREMLIESLNMNFDSMIQRWKDADNIELREGIEEISELRKYIQDLEIDPFVQFVATLARGQEYYTGTIFEAYTASGELKSSIGGGGRYDKMIGDFIGDGKKYPACGISFGLDAIFEILKQRKVESVNSIQVLIVPMENKGEALRIAEMLRKQEMNVDVELGGRKLKKVLEDANDRKIPFVMLIGEEELKENKVVLKNMKKGTQERVSIEEIFQTIQLESVPYRILNPGGNLTALVLGNEYTQEERKRINDRILKENKEVEQVGFLNLKEKQLEMAGGEFCVNATRCAIWEYQKGKPGEIELKVSGNDGKIIGGITENKEVYAQLKIGKKQNEILKQEGKFNIVKLDGIYLLVVDCEDAKDYLEDLRKNEEEGKAKLKELMSQFTIEEKAIGIILLEKEKEKIKINPVIWVKSIDTVYYETACGSGSLATAIWLNAKKGIESVEIKQPSGFEIKVQIEKRMDEIVSARVSGNVWKK